MSKICQMQQYILPYQDPFALDNFNSEIERPIQNDYQCYICKQVVNPQDIEIWGVSNEPVEQLHHNVDQNQIMSMINKYKTQVYQIYEQFVQQKRAELGVEPFDTIISWEERENFSKQTVQAQVDAGLSTVRRMNIQFFGPIAIGEIKQKLDEKFSYQNIQNIFGEISTRSKDMYNRTPVCKECAEDLPKCTICDRKVVPGADKYRKYKNDQTVDGCGGIICDKCDDRGYITYCNDCGRVLLGEDPFGEYFVPTDNGNVCTDCTGKPMDHSHYDQVLEEEGLKTNTFLPFDAKDIQKIYLPFFELLMNKLGEDALLSADIVKNWATRQNLKDDKLNTVIFIANKFQEVGKSIKYLEDNLAFQEQFKKEYPEIKSLKHIPADVEAESSGQRDVSSMTFVMRPNRMLMDYVDKIIPGATQEWAQLLSGGHHSKALAYCRVSEHGNDWMVDNLQTDSDLQKLSKSKGDLEEINNLIQKQTLFKRDGKWLEKRPEGLYELTKDEVNDLNTSLALSFWNKTMRHWPVMLLHIVKAAAKAEGKNLFVSNYSMQQEKWSRIPERNEDIYNRIPRQMGGEATEWSGRPERLPEATYDVVQLADYDGFIVYAYVKQRNPGEFAFKNWYYTCGGNVASFQDAKQNNSLDMLFA